MDPQEDKLRVHSAPLTMNREGNKCRNDVGRDAATDDHLKFRARVGTLGADQIWAD